MERAPLLSRNLLETLACVMSLEGASMGREELLKTVQLMAVARLAQLVWGMRLHELATAAAGSADNGGAAADAGGAADADAGVGGDGGTGGSAAAAPGSFALAPSDLFVGGAVEPLLNLATTMAQAHAEATQSATGEEQEAQGAAGDVGTTTGSEGGARQLFGGSNGGADASMPSPQQQLGLAVAAIEEGMRTFLRGASLVAGLMTPDAPYGSPLAGLEGDGSESGRVATALANDAGLGEWWSFWELEMPSALLAPDSPVTEVVGSWAYHAATRAVAAAAAEAKEVAAAGGGAAEAETDGPRNESAAAVAAIAHAGRRVLNFVPAGGTIELVQLPRAYTELHSYLTSLTESEHPAVCLVCGEVLDADGKGQCTKHAKTCGLGVGTFFLLQECSVLLIHGSRACYFASPYVDAHGERHGQFRGRPLFIDPSRLAVLRNLAAGHEVPSKVVHSRSTSRQVIINSYY